ncbi:Nuclear transition protein like [Heracleum sosnowskyi]|uniref:Nuclear transition protein like n=1 Tax=Heracleum sosnowskyi TaxID=360622 RepID=A0AAD8N6T8_9APIA|nr:Nuclear transition protein like [Heracleum sosnowskyi]
MIHQPHINNTLFLTILIFSILTSLRCSKSDSPTIYDVLKSHGLPQGLLPKDIKDFSFDDSGRFQVHLNEPCNAKFENELHYDQNISGSLSYGEINELSGISAQDLFLWFDVKEIRVDVPSSGLIYFDVGVVYKQFSLSSFETPRDCLAVQDLQVDSQRTFTKKPAPKTSSGNLRYQLGFKDLAMGYIVGSSSVQVGSSGDILHNSIVGE